MAPRTTTAKTRVRMTVQSPSDRNTVVRVPYAVAWAAARGVALWTHYVVILEGEYGTARFDGRGGGSVTWNDKSHSPGMVTAFDASTTVAI